MNGVDFLEEGFVFSYLSFLLLIQETFLFFVFFFPYELEYL